MRIEFADSALEQLETDESQDKAYPMGIPKSFRKRIGIIRAAVDERDLYALRSNRTEKLKGKRDHQHSMRLNDQFRLIFEIVENDDEKIIRVIAIEDYHP